MLIWFRWLFLSRSYLLRISQACDWHILPIKTKPALELVFIYLFLFIFFWHSFDFRFLEGRAFAQDNENQGEEDGATSKEKLVPHPFADKGLIRIKSDGTYIYATEMSDQDRASSLRFGMYEPQQLSNPDTEVEFTYLYPDSSMPILLYDYEWQLWRGPFGKLGWKVGTGIYTANGNGSFKSAENASITPRENFTFIALPNSIGLIYRLQFWDSQPLVPFVEGGLDAITFAEIRDDNKGPKFGLATAAHGSGGVAFNIGLLDKSSVITLDREFGINSVWITLEYRLLLAINKKFDFSENFLNGGVMVEF
ncbi:MAG: hypothetical protein KDD35_07915 [Bdellovibrionales bacterium]|nr:hypothetical protein [Bdellovibrionales bacterium]